MGDDAAVQWFDASVLHQLVHIPRLADEALATMDDSFELVRRAALVSANRAGRGSPVMLCWTRAASTTNIQVVMGGFDTAPHHGASDSPDVAELTYPIGSLGRAVPWAAVYDQLTGLPSWAALTVDDRAVFDEKNPEPGGVRRRPTLEDALAAVWTGPFAVCVFAVPSTRQRVDEQLAAAEAATRAPAARGARYEAELSVHRRRYMDLLGCREEGLWQVLIAVGARDPGAMMSVRALVTSTIDLDSTRFQLQPDIDSTTLGDLLGRTWAERDRSLDVPSAILARIARPPRREIPGIRSRLATPFDLTPETDGPVGLGALLDAHDRVTGQLSVSLDTLNRHTFVCGATGSGKSQTVRHLLETASRLEPPLPWLVIEPAKAEYAGMAGRLDDLDDQPVLRLRPGHVAGLAAGMNPLEPCPDPSGGAPFPLQTHLDLVRALFLAAFDAQEPFPQVLSAALARCYSASGWNLVTGRPAAGLTAAMYPTLGDLQRFAQTVIAEIGYGQDVANNVKGFVDVRLNSLRLGTPGRVLEGAHPLAIADVLTGQVVVELEDIGDDQDKAFMMGMLLIRIVEHLRLTHQHTASDAPLRHLLVIEEAHRLLRRGESTSPANQAVELFAGLLAEIRAYGEGLIVVEQIPSKVIPDVIKNTALKIMHRLPAADDREAVGATMNLTDAQSAFVVGLTPGRGVVFADGMDSPVLLAVPGAGRNREDSHRSSFDVPCAGPAFRLCADLCAGRCAVAEVQRAHDIAADRVLTMWVETEAVRLILGAEPVRPRPGPLARMAAQYHREPDRMTCAVHQLAEAAVRVRAPALAQFYHPDRLLERVAADVLATIRHPEIAVASTKHLCAGPFVAVAWHRQLAIDATLTAEQWSSLQVTADPDGDPVTLLSQALGRPDLQALRPVLLLGTGLGGVIERCAGGDRDDANYAAGLSVVLAPLIVSAPIIAALNRPQT